MLWQVGAIALCLALAWGLSRILRPALPTQNTHHARVIRLGVESFSRALWPLLALALIALAKPLLAHYQHVNLLRLAIPLIGSFALIRLAFYVMRRIFARTGPAGSFLQTFEKIFALLVWLGVALYITGLWPDLLEILENTAIPIGKSKVSILAIVQATVFVAITLILALWAGAALEERLMRVESMHSSMRVVLARMGRAVLILVAVLFSLSLVGIDLTVLSVFGGALGVGIGLGLQKIVGSYVSGFVILIERSLSIGDIVAVDKYTGKVARINTRYTVLRSGDGVESIIPNEMLLSGAVQNYSLSDRTVRLATQVGVAYDSDLDTVLPLLEKAVAAVPRVSAEPAPQALLLKFGTDALELEIGFWIGDPENGKLSVLSAVNKTIWQTLKENEISISCP
ncbi:MAG: mechanosensitive ion channel [Proteobacteria bacterium]|nr:mechanosensitive ion channel [Pseudomonadota bacterium]